MYTCELFSHLARQSAASGREFRTAHDPSSDRLTGNACHDECVAASKIGNVTVRTRRLDACLERHLEETMLVLQREHLSVGRASRRTSNEQFQRPVGSRYVDSPSFFRSAAREQDGGLDVRASVQEF
jgi:hypothetical protein